MNSEGQARRSQWLLTLGFALAYFAGAELSKLLVVKSGDFSALWPATGLYLAVLLISPSAQWPRLMAAAALADIASDTFHGQRLWVSVTAWLATTLEAVSGAWLLRSLFPSPFRLDRLRNVLGLACVCGLVSVPLGATVGALTLHVASGTVFSETWLTWWIADVVGILAFAPLVLAFKRDPEAPPAPLSSWRRLEAGLFVLTTALVVTVVFAGVPGRPVKFAVYPCLLWGALRFGLRGAAGGLSLVSLLAVALTAHGWDAFVAADLPPLNGMHVVQLFLIATELSFLSLAAVIAERDQASRQWAQLYDTVHRNRQQLEDVIETIAAMAWIALPDGTRLFANRHWREYTGLSNEATAGSGWQAAIHPEDIETYLAKRGASLASGEQYEVETRLRRAVDGEYRWFLVRAVPLKGERGDVLQWYGIAIDIEDRKRAEALLAGEKRILEMVARGASLAQILETLCWLVEEQIHDVLASVLLVEGNRLRHGAAPSLPESYLAAIDGMAIGPHAGSCGTAAYRAERVIVSDIATDPLWVEWREAALSHALRACWSTPILSSEGRVIATFALYHREPWSPTQRDQEIVEQITHLAGVAIQRKLGESLTRQVFERSPDGVSVVGRDYRYQRLNPVYERNWKMPAEKMVGMHVADLLGTGLFEHTVKPNLDRCFAGEQVSYAEWFTNAAGRFYLSVTYAPLRIHSEHVDAALVVTRDLTEHMLAVEALREAQAELAHVTRVTSLGELAASIAHEVKQPLAAIVADAEACRNWLAAPNPRPDLVREALDAIVTECHRTAEVVQRIRQLATKSAPRKASLDLTDVVRDVLRLVRSELSRHDVSLALQLAPELPPVLADRVQLQQVVLNLVVNAIEAMAPVTGRPRELVVRSEPHDQAHVRLIVQDTGVGVAADQLDQLFSAFFTTKPGGMGMGLSISRSIVEAHGGRLWATRNEPHGAVFAFTLPIAPGPPPGEGAPETLR